MKKIILKIITAYQKMLPIRNSGSCRFRPTCSQYTFQAINKYGIIKGLFLSTTRVIKCHPLAKGGWDPLK